MQIVKSAVALKQKLKNRKNIGFVPTMGALHAGHLSLIKAARQRSDFVVVSIFINPIQFGPGEDFKKYPRNLKKDFKLLKENGADLVFVPEVSEIYPKGFSTFVEVADLGEKLCGHSRPGHFRGVATVVAKLFNLVTPQIAFFGRKDFQQLVIIKRLVKDLNLNLKVAGLPTVREKDGLAKSSRNANLDEKERKTAAVLYKSLLLAKKLVSQGEKNSEIILKKIKKVLVSRPGIKLDYISICNPDDFEELKKVRKPALIALAVWLGKTRLIDNLLV